MVVANEGILIYGVLHGHLELAARVRNLDYMHVSCSLKTVANSPLRHVQIFIQVLPGMLPHKILGRKYSTQ